MHLTKEDIEQTDKVKRLNLVNAITGIKPANLIGTVSPQGQTNLAIFSSVVHLGSSPALLGFVTRPLGEVPRHTYANIVESGVYTINAIPQDRVEQAHYTSAKFDASVSEFERCGFKTEYIQGFEAPFVAESPIKIGMKLVEQIPIKLNGTILMVGSVEHLIINSELVDGNGYLDLPKGKVAGIGGLNTYYGFEQIGQFPYARVEEAPNFLE